MAIRKWSVKWGMAVRKRSIKWEMAEGADVVGDRAQKRLTPRWRVISVVGEGVPMARAAGRRQAGHAGVGLPPAHAERGALTCAGNSAEVAEAAGTRVKAPNQALPLSTRILRPRSLSS